MVNLNDCYRLLKKINRRMDSVEEMLKIIAVNDLIDELNIETKHLMLEMDENVKNILNKYGANVVKEEEVCDKTALYLFSEFSWQVEDVMEILYDIKDVVKNVIPVFIFERCYELDRRRLIQENISYYIPDRELHIYF